MTRFYNVGPEPIQIRSPEEIPDSLQEMSETVGCPRFLLGWREWLQLPDLDVPGIKVKVDTGARSSALHTANYEVYETPEGERVRFILHPIKGRSIERECDAAVLCRKDVKDSGGHGEWRPFIRTTATIGMFSWPIDISLTNREGMRFRMLLGRQALKGFFVVDPQFSYLMSRNLVHRYA